MKGIELPFSFIVFLIILFITFALILMWHFGGLARFQAIMGNYTHGVVENASGGAIKGP